MSGCDHKFVDSSVCLKCGVGFSHLKMHRGFPRAAPEPAAPEMQEGWRFEIAYGGMLCADEPVRVLMLDKLRALLATQGLSICTEAERKVLEACKVAELTDFGYGPQLTVHSAERIARELARRGER